MTLVAGIDPGLSGAIAVYDTDQRRIVSVDDIPTFAMTIGKKKRQRLDNLEMMKLFDTYQMMGVELCVLEAVGGRPGQSASAGFVFGYIVGSLVQMMMERQIMIETTPPATWKSLMKIPGKNKASDDDIMKRADDLFPKDTALFRGPKGGKMVDRAEAAMLSKFGADHVLRIADGKADIEYTLAYRKADVGA